MDCELVSEITVVVVKSMRNGLDGEIPENAERAFSGAFVTSGKTDFELFHYKFEDTGIGILIEESGDR